ncbi:MAG: phosphoglucosamine mutase [Propionibacteriaceae bacterium]|jgi:phosphoglucosamine mutase|nr:phosphoglucosamine mutase [Propionibacteriaceae bacterium]
MPKLFGTDGVRGVANADLTPELTLSLTTAAARVLGQASDGKLKAVVGRDTRASGEFLQAAVVAGLASAGVDVIRLGVIPTPGTAFLTGAFDADLGVMLSASHNPMPDNGIKFFARGGVKLDDFIEDEIEAVLDQPWQRPTGAGVGRVSFEGEGIEVYINHLVESLGALPSNDGSPSIFTGTPPLAGLKIVIDAANGAAHRTAVEAFRRTGAEVIAIHAEPDGYNINEHAGSTHPEALMAKVVEAHADMGIALDGDADRCLAVDHLGELVDGDQIMAILALALKREDALHSDTVVATVMSNLGFLKAMKAAGIHVDVTKVGDRYVLEDMNANGFNLGGEQSGHVIMSEYATTGDGVLTGLHLAAEVCKSGKTLNELAKVMKRFPQVLVNVSNVNKTRAGIDPVVSAAVTAAEQELGDSGRVLLRPSGTEPLVRVMVEAVSIEQAREIADRLAEVVKTRLSL